MILHDGVQRVMILSFYWISFSSFEHYCLKGMWKNDLHLDLEGHKFFKILLETLVKAFDGVLCFSQYILTTDSFGPHKSPLRSKDQCNFIGLTNKPILLCGNN